LVLQPRGGRRRRDPVVSIDKRRFEFLGYSAEITPHGPIVL